MVKKDLQFLRLLKSIEEKIKLNLTTRGPLENKQGYIQKSAS
jgi:hypothetical protein